MDKHLFYAILSDCMFLGFLIAKNVLRPAPSAATSRFYLLHTAPPRLFVTGPPGTGKSVMLLLMGSEWLRCGHDVYVVSSWIETLAASTMLFHLLLATVEKLRRAGQSPGQVHFLKYDGEQGMEEMVNDLSQLAKEDTLHVLEDEISGYVLHLSRDNKFHLSRDNNKFPGL